jgi:hypothetical protein
VDILQERQVSVGRKLRILKPREGVQSRRHCRVKHEFGKWGNLVESGHENDL